MYVIACRRGAAPPRKGESTTQARAARPAGRRVSSRGSGPVVRLARIVASEIILFKRRAFHCCDATIRMRKRRNAPTRRCVKFDRSMGTEDEEQLRTFCVAFSILGHRQSRCDANIEAHKTEPAVTLRERPATLMARDAKTSAKQPDTGRTTSSLTLRLWLACARRAMH